MFEPVFDPPEKKEEEPLTPERLRYLLIQKRKVYPGVIVLAVLVWLIGLYPFAIDPWQVVSLCIYSILTFIVLLLIGRQIYQWREQPRWRGLIHMLAVLAAIAFLVALRLSGRNQPFLLLLLTVGLLAEAKLFYERHRHVTEDLLAGMPQKQSRHIPPPLSEIPRKEYVPARVNVFIYAVALGPLILFAVITPLLLMKGLSWTYKISPLFFLTFLLAVWLYFRIGRFQIDSSGISAISRRRTLHLRWNEIVSIAREYRTTHTRGEPPRDLVLRGCNGLTIVLPHTLAPADGDFFEDADAPFRCRKELEELISRQTGIAF